jgi:hypothetical protein
VASILPRSKTLERKASRQTRNLSSANLARLPLPPPWPQMVTGKRLDEVLESRSFYAAGL